MVRRSDHLSWCAPSLPREFGSAPSFAQQVYVVAFGRLHAKDGVIDKIRIVHLLELCPSRFQFPLGRPREVEQLHVLLSGCTRMAGGQFPDRSPVHLASPGAIFAQLRTDKTRAVARPRHRQ